MFILVPEVTICTHFGPSIHQPCEPHGPLLWTAKLAEMFNVASDVVRHVAYLDTSDITWCLENIKITFQTSVDVNTHIMGSDERFPT